MGKNQIRPEHQRFVNEYLRDCHGTAAYMRAYPGCTVKTAESQASRLLKKPAINEALKVAWKDAARVARVTRADVLRALTAIAFADIQDVYEKSANGRRALWPTEIPSQTRKAIQHFRLVQRFERKRGSLEKAEIEQIEVSFCDKIKALDMLMKHLGLYDDAQPVEELLNVLKMMRVEETSKSIDESST